MTENFEDRLRYALHQELNVVEVAKHQSVLRALAGPRQLQKTTPRGAVVAAAAIAVVAVASASLVFGGSSEREASNSPESQQAIPSNYLHVQGANVFLPDGMVAVDASHVETDITHPRQFCLLPKGKRLGAQGCLNEDGILIRIAQVSKDNAVTPVQGAFQHSCTGSEPTIPILTRGSIGRRKADVITITCGQEQQSSSTFWQTIDRTFTIQSPYNGSIGRDLADAVAANSDLSDWLHTS